MKAKMKLALAKSSNKKPESVAAKKAQPVKILTKKGPVKGKKDAPVNLA